jgi:autoinducer 2 (AI-2) kinase
VRAIEESAAFTAMAHYEILQRVSGEAADRLVFCGGAAKGTLWPQIMADVFDLPVYIPKVTESTSLGGAFCALVALGDYRSLDEASHALVRWDRTEQPDRERAACYREVRKRANRTLQDIMSWVKEGRLQAMWRAPGAIISTA